MLDPIAEMLTIIRNAQGAGKKTVTVGASKLKLAIASILAREGFVESVSKEADGNREIIRIGLKYHSVSNTRKVPAIAGIKRVSKEGQRIYVGKDEVNLVKNGYGIGIISTSKGVMTDKESRKAGLGGEYVCQVW